MLFGKHINRYYLKYAPLFILGILALVAVDVIQLFIPEYLGEVLKHATLQSGIEVHCVLIVACPALRMVAWPADCDATDWNHVVRQPEYPSERVNPVLPWMHAEPAGAEAEKRRCYEYVLRCGRAVLKHVRQLSPMCLGDVSNDADARARVRQKRAVRQS